MYKFACLPVAAALLSMTPHAVAQQPTVTIKREALDCAQFLQPEKPNDIRRALVCLLAQQEREIVNYKRAIGAADAALLSYVDVARDVAASLAELETAGIPYDARGSEKTPAELVQLIDSSDVTVSAKMSALMEAVFAAKLRGDTIESYGDTLSIDGKKLSGDVLRIGRVGLYFLSQNGRKASYWNHEKRAWVSASRKVRQQIKKGIAVARFETAPELLLLPMPAPVERMATTMELPATAPIAFDYDMRAGLDTIDGADFDVEGQSMASLDARFKRGEQMLEQLAAARDESFGELVYLNGGASEKMRGYVSESERALTHLHTHTFIDATGTALASIDVKAGKMMSSEQLSVFLQGQLEEIRAASEVARFRYPVQQLNGETFETTVVRVGTFNIVTNGYYLGYEPQTRVLRKFKKQTPNKAMIGSTTALLESTSEMVPFGTDVTQNQVLEAYSRLPDL